MKNTFVLFAICLLASTAYSTQQVPEKLIYKGHEHPLACLPLEEYFDANHPRPEELIGNNTACHRGYVGTWEIKDKGLYLKSLERFRMSGPMKKIPFSLVFKDQKPPVKATWYTGVLRMPQGKMLRSGRMLIHSTNHDEDLHAGFQRANAFFMYEKDIYVRVEQGNIISEQSVDNKADGATRSIHDWGWVMSGSGEIKDDFRWHDLRDVVSEVFSSRKESGESFRTRAIYWTNEKSKKAMFWMPATPATDIVGIPPESMPKNHTIQTGRHVEITAHFEKKATGYSLHVDSIRLLKPGETMHHPDFKPPEKPSQETSLSTNRS